MSEPTTDVKTQLMLGEIKGIVEGLRDGQAAQNRRFDSLDGRIDKVDGRMERMDERLRNVEQKAAVSGALSGGAMGIGVALIIEGLKGWMRHPGGGGQ